MHNLHSLPLLNHTLEYSLEKLRQKVYLSSLLSRLEIFRSE